MPPNRTGPPKGPRAEQSTVASNDLLAKHSATHGVPDEGAARRDEGRDLALDSSSGIWRSAAWAAIERHAHSRIEFVSDDIREEVGDPIAHGSLNAWGGLFSSAIKAGLIRRVGSVQSRRPAAHRRWIAVYRGVDEVQP